MGHWSDLSLDAVVRGSIAALLTALLAFLPLIFQAWRVRRARLARLWVLLDSPKALEARLQEQDDRLDLLGNLRLSSRLVDLESETEETRGTASRLMRGLLVLAERDRQEVDTIRILTRYLWEKDPESPILTPLHGPDGRLDKLRNTSYRADTQYLARLQEVALPPAEIDLTSLLEE